MTLSLNDTEPVLTLLTEIRRTESHTIGSFSNNGHCIPQFDHRIMKLDDAVCTLRAAVPSDPTDSQISAVRGYVDYLRGKARGAKHEVAADKPALDVIQTRFEESDI